MSLERVVRPFQRNDVFTARVLAPVQPAVPPNTDNTTITWDGSSDASVDPAPPTYTWEFHAEWDEDKDQRKTDTVRIRNPDDQEQYIDVERITQMVFKNPVNKQEIKVKPSWDS
jgi:hypothetical protein